MAPTKLEEISAKVNEAIEDFCGGIATKVVRHPRKTIAIQYAVTVICAMGFTQLTYDNLPERLYVPQDTEAFEDRDYVEARYGFTPTASAIAIDGSTNLLAREPLRHLFDLHDKIMLLEREHGHVAYDERYCFLKGGVCQRSGILAFWDWNRTKFELDDDILATVNNPTVPNLNDENERYVVLRNWASDYEHDANGTVVRATKLLFRYYLGIHLHAKPRKDPHGEKLEVRFTDCVVDFESRHFDAWPDNRALRDMNSVTAVNRDQILINLCLLLVFAYTMYCFSNRNHGESHAFLGAQAVLTVFAAIGAGFGVGVGMGIVFNPSTMIAIFLVLGIGIDDAFVIYGAYQIVDRNEHRSVDDAVVASMRSAGASITVTSITDVCAFIAGSFISIPALSSFCVFSALAVFVDYSFQITAFVAWMTLDMRKAEERQGKDCCCLCCPCLPGAKKRAAAAPTQICAEDRLAAADKGSSKDAEDPEKVVAPIEVHSFFGGPYATALLSKPGKVGVLAVTAVLVALGVVGCQNFAMDFDVEWFLTRRGPYGFVYEHIDLRDKWFSHQKLFPARIFTKDGDYWAEKDKIARMLDHIRAEGGTAKSLMDYNWFTQHEIFDEVHMPPKSNSSAEYFASVRHFLAGPGKGYTDSVLFDPDDPDRITSAAYPIFWKFANDKAAAAAAVRKMVKQRRIIADHGALDAILFNEVFVFLEGLVVVVRETVTSLCLASLAVFVVLIVLLANVQLALLILCVCVMESVCLLGAIHWYDDRLNSITAFFIIIAVGLSVDCSAHIAHTFQHAEGATRDARARYALNAIGSSVFKGGLSTFFGICITAFASSYIFWCFFKFLASIIAYAVYFGMVVVPVILSLVGPMQEHSAPVSPAPLTAK